MSLFTRRMLMLMVLAAAPVQTVAEYYLDVGSNCVSADDPGTCMESYGFRCHQLRLPGRSLEAHGLGCNLSLADGRRHFVQIINDGSKWRIETERTSDPNTEIRYQIEDDANIALTDYISTEMKPYRVSGSGGSAIPELSSSMSFEVGARKSGQNIIVRAVCGVNYEQELSDELARGAQDECEKTLLRDIRIRSQFTPESPYRAAGANEITWQTTDISLSADSVSLIMDGRYSYPFTQKSCRFMPNCCSYDGAMYLDSCRTPTKEETDAIKSCLNPDIDFRSDDYYQCLKDAGVKAGCETQKDGSRLCY